MAQGLMSRRLAGMGRRGDTEVGHLTRGEVVVPRDVLRRGDTRRQLSEGFDEAGAPMGRYIVGGMDDSRNPRTGLREFFGPGDSFGPGDGAGGGESPGGGDGYSGPGPGEMGQSPDTAFSGTPDSPDTPGGDGMGRGRGGHPSRATPGAGYHADTGHPGVTGLSPQAVELAARDPNSRQSDVIDLTPIGYKSAIISLVQSIIDPEKAKAENTLRDAQLEGWNRGRMDTGKAHFDPDTGRWSSDKPGLKGVVDALNPRGWHRAPSWANEARWNENQDPPGDDYRNGLIKPPEPKPEPKPDDTYNTGYYTPPWKRFLPDPEPT